MSLKEKSIVCLILLSFIEIVPACDDHFTSEGNVIIESKGQTIDLVGMLVHILGFSRLHPVTDDTAGTGKFVSVPSFNRNGRATIDYNGNTVRLEINRDQQDVGTVTNLLELTATNTVFVITGASSLKIGDGNTSTATNGGDVFTIEWLTNGVVLLTAVT